MSNYIDGFAFPIDKDKLAEYRKLSMAVSEIWKEHGALGYFEYQGDDMALDGTRSFSDALNATDDQIIIFGWVLFASREIRDTANKKVASDPRMADLVNQYNTGFNAEQMVYGGFHPLNPH